MPFYPDDAPVPSELRSDEFVVRMLRAADAELDYEAVMASREILHLRSGGDWPRDGFTLAENLADLEQHEAEFRARTSFAYTVMTPTQTHCLGCVYLDPLAALLRHVGASAEAIDQVEENAAQASFWVRQDRLADDLDRRLLAALVPWLRHEFAFSRVLLRAFAREERQVAIMREAGLRLVAASPVADTQLLLFE